MSRFINDEKKAMLHRILDSVIDINNAGHDSFFSFSGHVKDIDVKIYENRWEDDEIAINESCLYLTQDTCEYSGEETISVTPEERLKVLCERLEGFKAEM